MSPPRDELQRQQHQRQRKDLSHRYQHVTPLIQRVELALGAALAAPPLDDRTTQDEELAVTTGLPSQRQVIELLGADFACAGYEIEDVVIDARARPPRIAVIADGDAPLDLDTIAALSRRASALLDGLDGANKIRGRYLLEVSSPGVERPLTSEKHFRRARGRKVELVLSDGSRLTGRVGEMRAGTVALVIPVAST